MFIGTAVTVMMRICTLIRNRVYVTKAWKRETETKS